MYLLKRNAIIKATSAADILFRGRHGPAVPTSAPVWLLQWYWTLLASLCLPDVEEQSRLPFSNLLQKVSHFCFIKL